MVEEVVRPPTMVDAASNQIEQAIFSGELLMGEPLTEARLVKDLNVSRGTVREALIALQDRGLVDVIPHQGAFVAMLDCRAVIETYTTRALIEPYAAMVSLNAGALDEKLISRLSDALDGMRLAEEDKDLERISRFDVEFHLMLLEASGHRVLINVFSTLLTRTRLCIFQNILLSGVPMSPNPHEHYEILDAIKAHSAAKITRGLHDHSAKALDHFLAHQASVDLPVLAYRTSLIKQLPWPAQSTILANCQIDGRINE